MKVRFSWPKIKFLQSIHNKGITTLPRGQISFCSPSVILSCCIHHRTSVVHFITIFIAKKTMFFCPSIVNVRFITFRSTFRFQLFQLKAVLVLITKYFFIYVFTVKLTWASYHCMILICNSVKNKLESGIELNRSKTFLYLADWWFLPPIRSFWTHIVKHHERVDIKSSSQSCRVFLVRTSNELTAVGQI